MLTWNAIVSSYRKFLRFLGINNDEWIDEEEIEEIIYDIANAISVKRSAGNNEQEIEAIMSMTQDLQMFCREKEWGKAKRIYKDLKEWSSENTSGTYKFTKVLEIGLPFLMLYFVLSFIGVSHVPSGSMRFAVQENDKTVVSSADFNIRYWGFKKPVLFFPETIQKGDFIMWRDRTKNAPIALLKNFKSSSMQLLKRCAAKPGDTLYFYGGNLYVVDKNGVLDKQFLEMQDNQRIVYSPIFSKNPFLMFSKQIKNISDGSTEQTFYLFGEKVYGIRLSRGWRTIIRNFYQNSADVNDLNLYGSKYYFEGEILSPEEAMKEGYEGDHHVMAVTVKSSIEIGSAFSNTRILNERIFIEIDSNSIERIFSCINTERFVITNGVAHILSNADSGGKFNEKRWNTSDFQDVIDGVYEIEKGKVFKIVTFNPTFGLIPFLSFSSRKEWNYTSLSDKSMKNVKRLFNCGINIASNTNDTRRMLCFRHGDLYLEGGKLFDKHSFEIIKFSKEFPEFDGKDEIYTDGVIDIDKIRQKGFVVPEDYYILLGDNYPLSSDSRICGPVHKDNVEGRASLIFSLEKDRSRLSTMFKVDKKIWLVRGIAIMHFVVIIAIIEGMKAWRRKFREEQGL